jgi:hypothetical protein
MQLNLETGEMIILQKKTQDAIISFNNKYVTQLATGNARVMTVNRCIECWLNYKTQHCSATTLLRPGF